MNGAAPPVLVYTHQLNRCTNSTDAMICTHMDMHSHTYALIYICTHMDTHSYTYALTYIRTHIHMHSYTYALIYMCTHIHMHSYTCARTCTHERTHAGRVSLGASTPSPHPPLPQPLPSLHPQPSGPAHPRVHSTCAAAGTVSQKSSLYAFLQ